MENVALVMLVAILVSVVASLYVTVLPPHTAVIISAPPHIEGTYITHENNTIVYLVNTGGTPAHVDIYLINGTSIQTVCNGYIIWGSGAVYENASFGEIDLEHMYIPPTGFLKVVCNGIYENATVVAQKGSVNIVKKPSGYPSTTLTYYTGYLQQYLPVPGSATGNFMYALPVSIIYDGPAEDVTVRLIVERIDPTTDFLLSKIGPENVNEIAVMSGGDFPVVLPTRADFEDGVLVVSFRALLLKGVNEFWILFVSPSLGENEWVPPPPPENKMLTLYLTEIYALRTISGPPLAVVGLACVPSLSRIGTVLEYGDSASSKYQEVEQNLYEGDIGAVDNMFRDAEQISYPLHTSDESGGTHINVPVTAITKFVIGGQSIEPSIGYIVEIASALKGYVTGASVLTVGNNIYREVFEDVNVVTAPKYWNIEKEHRFRASSGSVSVYLAYYGDSWDSYFDFAVSISFVTVLQKPETSNCVVIDVDSQTQLVNYVLPVKMSDLGLTPNTPLNVVAEDGSELYHWVDETGKYLYIRIPNVPAEKLSITVCPTSSDDYNDPSQVFTYWNSFDDVRHVIMRTSGDPRTRVTNGKLVLIQTTRSSGVWAYLATGLLRYYSAPTYFHIHAKIRVDSLDAGFAITFYRAAPTDYRVYPSTDRSAAITGYIELWGWRPGSSSVTRTVYLDGYAVLFSRNTLYGGTGIYLLRTGPSSVTVLKRSYVPTPIGRDFYVDIIYDGVTLKVFVDGTEVLSYQRLTVLRYRYVAFTASSTGFGSSDVEVDYVFVRYVPYGGDLTYTVHQP